MPEETPPIEENRNERKSRSLVNRAATKKTVLKLDGVELELADRVYESIFAQLKRGEDKLPKG